MTKIYLAIFLGITLLLSWSCKKESSLGKKYTGYWAETRFEYNFYSKSQEFVFNAQGHYGNTTTKGKFSIIDSIILLYPYTDWDSFHGVLKRRLVYKSELGCIRDFNDHYYCEDLDKINQYIEQRYDFKNSIQARLFKLEEVKKIIEAYPEFSPLYKPNPRFQFEGITLIDNKEYYGFQLEEKNEDENWFRPFINIQGQYYLVNIEENLIYQHHTRGDSISIVEKLFAN